MGDNFEATGRPNQSETVQPVSYPRSGICDRISTIMMEVSSEVRRAGILHPPMASHHEGYSVILEELDELWDEVKKRKSLRDLDAMRTEAIQVAAMAIRFIVDTIPAKPTGWR